MVQYARTVARDFAETSSRIAAAIGIMIDRLGINRRGVLYGVGSLFGLGSLRSSPFEDRDGDGIPDETERSEAHHQFMEETFGEHQFEGLDPERKDLLIDARYVGDASVSDDTKAFIEETFRDHGIHLQWLDYPDRYDQYRFDQAYGDRVERVLWPYRSFYSDAIEDELRDIALQIVVTPKESEELESLYTVHQGEDYEGVSFGNRCLITEQESREAESILLMHEIGHLVLCHTDNDDSVMSPSPETTRFTSAEWDRLRSNLDNIRDTTGFDVAFRKCLIDEYREEITAQSCASLMG